MSANLNYMQRYEDLGKGASRRLRRLADLVPRHYLRWRQRPQPSPWSARIWKRRWKTRRSTPTC